MSQKRFDDTKLAFECKDAKCYDGWKHPNDKIDCRIMVFEDEIGDIFPMFKCNAEICIVDNATDCPEAVDYRDANCGKPFVSVSGQLHDCSKDYPVYKTVVLSPKKGQSIQDLFNKVFDIVCPPVVVV